MEFIQDQIAEIEKDNNTAQEDFALFLDRQSKSTAELMFSENWSGELDFALLKQKGFHNVVKIEIYKASITRVKNLPIELTRLVIHDNLITSLDNLPKGVVELDLKNNYLQSLEIGALKSLSTLIVSNNQLESLGPLPDSLRILECDRNHLATLDLLPCRRLERLHCSGNPILVVKDPPATLVDFVMDNNPLTEIQRPFRKTDPKETETKIDYIEAIQSYFKMKAEYETKETALKRSAFEKEALKREGKRRASSVKPPCINCKRKVGTIFSLKDKKYRAICGDVKEPCSLNIQIFGGRASNHTQTLYQFKEQMEELKETIIKQKMDTLFHYLDEKNSATIFKKNIEEYHSTNVLYKEILETHQELYDSPYKRELIQRKEVEIYELLRQIRELLTEYEKKTEMISLEMEEENTASAIMESITDLYQSLVNQMRALRMLKYKVVEVFTDSEGDHDLCTLQKAEVSPLDLEYSFGDSPHVIKFMRSTKK